MELGLGCLPILWSVLSLGAPIINYAIAVQNDNVYPFLPAISDTGSKSPESNLLATLLNLSMLACLLNICVRYYQCGVQIKYCTDSRDTLARLNTVGLLLAGFSMLGGIVVSNFESTQVNIQLKTYSCSRGGLENFFGPGTVQLNRTMNS